MWTEICKTLRIWNNVFGLFHDFWFFIHFNEYNSLSIYQYIFQNKNNFNSKKIKIVYLENVIFIHLNICPLAFFCQTCPFPTSICDQFQYCRENRFLSLTCFFSLTQNWKILTNSESKLSFYALPAHFAFFMLSSATKSLRYIILIVKKNQQQKLLLQLSHTTGSSTETVSSLLIMFLSVSSSA